MIYKIISKSSDVEVCKEYSTVNSSNYNLGDYLYFITFWEGGLFKGRHTQERPLKLSDNIASKEQSRYNYHCIAKFPSSSVVGWGLIQGSGGKSRAYGMVLFYLKLNYSLPVILPSEFILQCFQFQDKNLLLSLFFCSILHAYN